MRRAALVASLAAAVAAAPALAQTPPTRVTIVSVFDPITYGDPAYLNGQLIGDGQAGQPVTLQAAPYPFTTWSDIATITTDFRGYYSFKQRPSATTQYRTVADGVTSERQVAVDVAPLLTLRVGPAGRKTLRYSGTLLPAHDGQTVAIQRRGTSGAWTTVASPHLHGTKFQGRMRARKPAILRAFFATDGDHLDGFSPAVDWAPGARAAVSASAAACRAPVITRIAFKPARPVAGRAATLRVWSSLPGGRVYAVDVLWGEPDKRDHLTLAPALRKPSVEFVLRHRYSKRGSYRLTIHTYGIRDGCKRASAPSRPLVHVTTLN